MRLVLQSFKCVSVHKTRHVRTRPIACDRKNPPEENLPHNLTARGSVAIPKMKRTKAHHRASIPSLAPVVHMAITAAIAKGISKSA